MLCPKYYHFCGVKIPRAQFIKAIFGKEMPLSNIHIKIICDPDTLQQFHPSKNFEDRKLLSLALDLYPVGEDIIVGICLKFKESNNMVFPLGNISISASSALGNYLKTIDQGIPDEIRKLIKIDEAQYYLLIVNHLK